MANIIKTIAARLATNLNPVESGVHFHGGPQGAYVCENARCVSPSLDPTDR